MNGRLSVQEFWRIVWKQRLLGACIVVLIVGATAAVQLLWLKPVYEAETQILVNQKNINQELLWSQMETDLQLINTYNVIMKAPFILQKVLDVLDLKMSEVELRERIEVVNESNSKVVTVVVEHEDPLVAARIANEVAGIFAEEVPRLMSVDNITVISEAQELSVDEAVPVKPRVILGLGVALFVSLLVAVLVALVRELFDSRIRSEEDVALYMDLPILGFVGQLPKGK